MASDAEIREIGSVEGLASLYPPPSALAVAKVLPVLDPHCRRFIELSPFLCLGSASAAGMDVTPRGDVPGFVRVLDEATLAIPDRPGNNRLDTMKNLLANPEVGLLFFVPGVDETLRVNGAASISTDPELLRSMEANGKLPRAAIVVRVREAFFHCGKALKRSRLWDPAARVEKGTVPSLGRILADQTRPAGETAESLDAYIEKSYRERLY